MSGKGSDRRPAQVSDAELARRWAETFGELDRRQKKIRAEMLRVDGFISGDARPGRPIWRRLVNWLREVWRW